MKQIFITSYVAVLSACMCLMSCSDDSNDGALALLDAPVVTISEVTSSSIAFTWQAVDGARQYGYRVTDLSGEDVAAGVTTVCSAEATDLAPFTTYTIAVSAFPTNVGEAVAAQTVMDVPTLFYDAIEGYQTAYVSHLQANMATVTNRGTMNEDRSGEDYMENTYGVFTITKFCGVNGHDLVFTVNRDNTITVLNGLGYDDEGRVIVSTGKSSSATLSFDKIYIDESSAVFNGPGHTLTFSAQNNGTGDKLRVSNTETITWSEPE